jgi:hypothetical protein
MCEVSFASVVGTVVVTGSVVTGSLLPPNRTRQAAIAATTIIPAIAENAITLFFINITPDLKYLLCRPKNKKVKFPCHILSMLLKKV